MKKILVSGLIAGVVLLVCSIAALYATIALFPSIAVQYFNPVFQSQPERYAVFYIHPFVISLALSWFWSRFKGMLTGSFLTRGIEFGLIYTLIAILPMMLMLYSTLAVSLSMILTWFVFGWLQGIVTGLVFEKINP